MVILLIRPFRLLFVSGSLVELININRVRGINKKSLFNLYKNDGASNGLDRNTQKYFSHIIKEIIFFILLEQQILKAFLIANMQYNNVSKPKSLSNLSVKMMLEVLDYLDQQDLSQLSQIIDKSGAREQLKRIVRIRLLFAGYFNNCDRSFCFEVFNSREYLGQQKQTITSLAVTQKYSAFCQYPKNMTNMLELATQFVQSSQREQTKRKLLQNFTGPSLPMPKLIRETVAAEIKSTFQNFLVASSDRAPYKIFQQAFQSVRISLQEIEQHTMIGIDQNMGKVSSLISNPAAKQSLVAIPGCYHHNFIVGVLSIMESFVSAIEIYLSCFDSKFDLLLEIVSRYNQFQNIVLSVEENLADVFRSYGQLYSEVAYKPEVNFSFCKAAYAMWTDKISKFHAPASQAYCGIMKSTFACELQQQCDSNLEMASSGTLLALNCMKNSPAECAQYENSIYCRMLEQDEVEMLVCSYQEYLVDLSITNRSVHKCGHSEQQLCPDYEQAQTMLVEGEKSLVESLMLSDNVQNYRSQIQRVLVERVQVIGDKIKARSFKKILDLYQSKGLNLQCHYEEIMKKDYHIDNYLRRFDHLGEQKQMSDTVDSEGMSQDHIGIYDSDSEIVPQIDMGGSCNSAAF